jgi:hypothetical protein
MEIARSVLPECGQVQFRAISDVTVELKAVVAAMCVAHVSIPSGLSQYRSGGN